MTGIRGIRHRPCIMCPATRAAVGLEPKGIVANMVTRSIVAALCSIHGINVEFGSDDTLSIFIERLRERHAISLIDHGTSAAGHLGGRARHEGLLFGIADHLRLRFR